MMRNMPLPQMLKTTMVQSAISASSQFFSAEEMAVPASARPMQMIMGPVTTGGRKRITRFTPINLIIAASTRYKSPATTMPPQA